MRIAVAALMHETNTFNPIPTRREDFRTADGEAVYTDEFWRGGSSVTGIMEELARESTVEIVPLFFAKALPGGPVPLEDYLYLRRQIVDRLRHTDDVDGVCLALHGSMMVHGEPDPEGRLVSEVRAMVGRNAPIVAALDMHAKMSVQLESVIDAVVGYKTAPHLDAADTGRHAAKLLLHALKDGTDLALSTTRLPILIAGEKTETDMLPMKPIMDHVRKIEKDGKVMAASILLGFPWADTLHAGVTVAVVTSLHDEGHGRHLATSLAKEIWLKRRRFDFTSEACPLPEALQRATAEASRPVIISDSGDNPTAGAAQNMAFALKHAVESSTAKILVSAIADPDAYTEAAALGANARTTLEIGTVVHGETDPFVWSCTVTRLVSAKQCNAAILSDDRVTCILTDRRVATYEPSLIFECGLDPNDFDILIVKCGYQGPEYKALTKRSIVAITPGDSNEELSNLPFEKVPRPIFPLDSAATWNAP